jgi:hypothetical protein
MHYCFVIFLQIRNVRNNKQCYFDFLGRWNFGVKWTSSVTEEHGALRHILCRGPFCHTSLVTKRTVRVPRRQKNFRSVYHFGSQYIFPDIPQFFLKTKKFFRKHLKIFRIYDFFPQIKTFWQYIKIHIRNPNSLTLSYCSNPTLCALRHWCERVKLRIWKQAHNSFYTVTVSQLISREHTL